MGRNRIIRVATWCTWGILAVSLLFFISFLGILVHWHINPVFYNNWYIEGGFQAGMNSLNLVISDIEITGIPLGKLSPGMMYWIFFRTALIIVLSMAATWKMLKVLKSIGSLNTFYVNNIIAFRRLALIGLIISFISFFNFYSTEGSTQWHLTLPFGPLLFASACLVLSEVFKEGKHLLEDSNSII